MELSFFESTTVYCYKLIVLMTDVSSKTECCNTDKYTPLYIENIMFYQG